jgi:alpha-mannosidase
LLISLALQLPALLPPIQARALAQEDPESPASGTRVGLPARDTLFLIGDARIDPGLAARGRSEPDLLTATWRRALGFVEWTDGAVLVADGAANYVELARKDARLADSVRTTVRSGAWSPVGGWWTRGDPGSLSGESLIRQGLYGQRAFERIVGRRPTVAWLDDASLLPSTLPQILTGSGLTSLVLVGSEVRRGGAGRGTRATPTALDWAGNDGTRIEVFRPYDYGDFADFEFEFPGPRAVGERGNGHQLALYGVRDPEWESGIAGADQPTAISDIESAGADPESGAAQIELPVVRFASPARAIAVVRVGSDLPLPAATGEIAPPSTSVSGSSAKPATSARAIDDRSTTRVESLLRTAEALAAVHAGLPGAQEYPRSLLAQAWRDLLEAEVRAGQPDRTGSFGETRRAAIASAVRTADSVIAGSFAGIRSEMETDSDRAGTYILFNPLAHRRRGVAFVELGRGGSTGGGGPDRDLREVVLVNVPEIPALGAIALPIGADGLPGVLPVGIQAPTAGDLWLENAFLRVEIDPTTGAISSILDKTNRRQALSPDGRANVLIVSPDPDASPTGSPGGEATGETNAPAAGFDSAARGGPPRDEPGEVSRLLSLSSSVSARAATVTITRGWNGSTVRQELVLARAAPFLEVRSEIRWLETGWRLDVRQEPVVRVDSATFAAPYGTVSRPADNSGEHPALHWLGLTDGNYGVSVLADTRGPWKYDGSSIALRLPADSLAVVRFAIYPHAGDWRTAGTASLAAEYVVPLLAALEPAHAGRLGRRFSLVSTDSPTTRIEWVKRAEDDATLIFRLVERSGSPSEARVSTACPKITAWRANHLEEREVELPTSGSDFRIRLRGNEIATVSVDCRG